MVEHCDHPTVRVLFQALDGHAVGAPDRAHLPASAKKAAERAVAMYLKGVTLQVIKEMFKKFGIIFTQKAAQKAIPFGVGVIIGAGVNYALTKWVGSFALDTIAGIENT